MVAIPVAATTAVRLLIFSPFSHKPWTGDSRPRSMLDPTGASGDGDAPVQG